MNGLEKMLEFVFTNVRLEPLTETVYCGVAPHVSERLTSIKLG